MSIKKSGLLGVICRHGGLGQIINDLGEQPIARIMQGHALSPHDIVAASTEQITHKMVSRAVKGRRLTPNVQLKILNALNSASGKQYGLKDIFNY